MKKASNSHLLIQNDMLIHENQKLKEALCWGIGAALNELKARNLPLEWGPDGGIGKMLRALGVEATKMTDDVWDVVQGRILSDHQ